MLITVGKWLLIAVLLVLAIMFAMIDNDLVDIRDLVLHDPTVTPTPRNYMCDCILTQIPTPTPHPFSE